MISLKQLMSEQDEFNIYIDQKVGALRNHQNHLNKIIPEELVKAGLSYTPVEKNPNQHIFTYSELKIEIETKNPVDGKAPLSQAISDRLKIEISIARKLNSVIRKYAILDRTKYKSEYKENGTYRYSIYPNEESEKDLFSILERIFEHEVKQPMEDKDLPY
ncbi:hypothetical protein OHW15_18145 [Acinetobacter baumannii]|nr:hypothetical protein [Acinetobacter baumannii]